MVRLGIILSLLLGGSVASAHGVSAEDHAKILEGGNLEYLLLGAKHMLTGYDHLLFLFGVIFFLTRFGQIVKFITAFTIGHSITLIFATLLGIKANYFLIDAVIALTVCYKAFDNINGFKKYLNMASPNLLFMVFLFGLIHGFGLSTRLQQLPLGDHGLVVRILSFNVGVEIGQIVALSIMLILLSGWRRYASFKQFSLAANWILIGLGVLLMLMQLHSFEHARDLTLNVFDEDAHRHVHEEMQLMPDQSSQSNPDRHEQQSDDVRGRTHHKDEDHKH